MVRNVFITDCEGPLTLNDNAYEIAAEYIEDGDKLFKIIRKQWMKKTNRKWKRKKDNKEKKKQENIVSNKIIIINKI